MNSDLRKELFIVALLGSLALLSLFASPLLFNNWTHAGQRLGQSLLVFALIWQQLWHYRSLNRSAAAAPIAPALGWPNRLTVVRGVLIAACAGFIGQPPPTGMTAYLPALCYSLAVIADLLDGMLARRSNSTTLLGAKLDTSYDAIGLVAAPLVGVGFHKLHPAYLLVSVAYYLFVSGCYWRQQHHKPVLPLRPSKYRRMLAGTQMTLVAIALWPPVPATVSLPAGIVFMLPFLAGFWIDWLVVSARLPLTSDNRSTRF